MSRIAVVTPVAGRGAQLRAQERHLAALDNGPDVRVLVAMDDPGVARLAGDMPSAATHIVSVRRGRDGGLPLARARNAGIAGIWMNPASARWEGDGQPPEIEVRNLREVAALLRPIHP